MNKLILAVILLAVSNVGGAVSSAVAKVAASPYTSGVCDPALEYELLDEPIVYEHKLFLINGVERDLGTPSPITNKLQLCLRKKEMVEYKASKRTEELAISNMGYELVECGIYFSIISGSLSQHPQTAEGSKSYMVRARKKIQMSVLLTNQKVTIARMELITAEQVKEMEDNFNTTSSLRLKYEKICFTDINVRMQYWLDK